MQLWRIRALLALGRTEEAETLLTPDLSIADIKEGELSLSALWFEIKSRKIAAEKGIPQVEALSIAKESDPLPYALDFRMHE